MACGGFTDIVKQTKLLVKTTQRYSLEGPRYMSCYKPKKSDWEWLDEEGTRSNAMA